MLARTRWRVVEEPCLPAEAASRWHQARGRGATGAVTSWASGIRCRNTIRLYWEAGAAASIPEGEDLEEEDWSPLWKQSLGPIRASASISVVPVWEAALPELPCTLRIDPGMVFGAGDHPTTRLCLRLLEELSTAGALPAKALDVGTGTGVLALAAARLGAASVDALDIDPFGFAASRRNACLNGLTETVRPRLLSLDLVGEDYPLVLANLVASQLDNLEADLRGRVAVGGRLLLSGFSTAAEASVRERLLRGWALEGRRDEDGWVAIVGRRPGPCGEGHAAERTAQQSDDEKERHR